MVLMVGSWGWWLGGYGERVGFAGDEAGDLLVQEIS